MAVPFLLTDSAFAVNICQQPMDNPTISEMMEALMKIFKSRICIHSFAVLIAVSFLVTGCAKTVTPSPTPTATQTATPTATSAATATPTPTTVAQPPSIPPLETFLIPFAEFTSGGSTSAAPDQSGYHVQFASYAEHDGSDSPFREAAFGDQSNWNSAAFTVGFWNVVVVIGLAVPVAAFAASFQNIPLQQPDGSWIWSYAVNLGGTVYNAELHGEYIAQGVHWEMSISEEGSYQDFLWYYGENNLPATEGFWILKDNPTNQTDLLRIDWSRSIADGTYDIKYTNIVPGGAENGGYIYVQYTEEIPYDYLWDIYNKGQDNHTYIEWSSLTEEGRIKDSKAFADSEWHCWDSSHTNTECASET